MVTQGFNLQAVDSVEVPYLNYFVKVLSLLYFIQRPLATVKPTGLGTTIIFIIFLDFLMFHQISLSRQVKRLAIITYEHGIYE